MATEIWDGALGELRRASTEKGTALSPTPVFIALPAGTRHVFIEGRNYSTGVVAEILKNPWLVVLKTSDALSTITDYSEEAQDADANSHVILSSLDTLANGDYLLIGSVAPFRGVYIDIDGSNSNASILTVKYRKSDDTWASVSATDGTASGGASLAQDGTVAWTAPSDWKKASLAEVANPGGTVLYRGEQLYWTRWEWSAALDSSVTLDAMLAMGQNTNYFELVSGRALGMKAGQGLNGIGCIEARMDAGTGNLIVNVASGQGDFFKMSS